MFTSSSSISSCSLRSFSSLTVSGAHSQNPGTQTASPPPDHASQTPGPSVPHSLTTQSTSQTTGPGQSEDDQSYRLPSDLKPIFYDLDLAPDIYGDDPATFSFQGHVGIVIECVSPTSTITLNAKNLSISRSDVAVSGESSGALLGVVDVELKEEEEMLSIALSDRLVKGERYRVDIDFSGPLTNDLTGLYLSSYSRGNETVWAS